MARPSSQKTSRSGALRHAVASVARSVKQRRSLRVTRSPRTRSTCLVQARVAVAAVAAVVRLRDMAAGRMAARYMVGMDMSADREDKAFDSHTDVGDTEIGDHMDKGRAVADHRTVAFHTKVNSKVVGKELQQACRKVSDDQSAISTA